MKEYRKKTGKELDTHPLAEEIKGCDSPEAILTVLRGKANELNGSQSSDERLTKWLTPTVNVLNSLSATLGEGFSIVSVSIWPDNRPASNVQFQVFPPTKAIFAGISILLVVSRLTSSLCVDCDSPQAARNTAASRDELIGLFSRMENFFVRLQTYTKVPPTPEMTKVMGEIMAEVLSMLAIATKEMTQGRTSGFIFCAASMLSLTQIRAETFFKKLFGRTDIEDALQKLDKLEQGELRTVTAQVLNTTCDIKDGALPIHLVGQVILNTVRLGVKRIEVTAGARDCSYFHDPHRKSLYQRSPSW